MVGSWIQRLGIRCELVELVLELLYFVKGVVVTIEEYTSILQIVVERLERPSLCEVFQR